MWRLKPKRGCADRFRGRPIKKTDNMSEKGKYRLQGVVALLLACAAGGLAYYIGYKNCENDAKKKQGCKCKTAPVSELKGLRGLRGTPTTKQVISGAISPVI